jgi:hypothetical protein
MGFALKRSVDENRPLRLGRLLASTEYEPKAILAHGDSCPIAVAVDMDESGAGPVDLS